MKKQGKRWLSILLAGVLVLLAPAAALAIQGDTAGEGSTEYIEVEACPGHLLGSVNGLPACVNAAGDLHVCENNFPDRNFKTIIVRQLYGEEAFGIEYFTKEDLEDRTILNVEIYSIRSLQGIGYFPNLKDLNCSGNWMKKLDLSHNPQLERLRCQNNRLEALDVSVLPNLTYLDCGENELTALDVSGNPLLETLCCDFNSLTELHVEFLPNLSYLDCHMNLLTELDVGYNAELTELYCQSNRLTALDVSGNPKLTNLRCYENQLTGLDLSYNTQLKEENVSLRQTLFAQSVATDSGWEVHLSAYLPPESLERVLSVSAGTYDAASGTVSFDRKPSAFQVIVATGREGLDMPIDFAPVEDGAFAGRPACVTAGGDLHICEKNFPDENFRSFLFSRPEASDGCFSREEMEGYPDWQEGLARLKDSGEYMGIIVSLEGEYLEHFLSVNYMTSGAFDQEAFESGNYVLTAGANAQGVSSLAAGEQVVLEGQAFTVLGSTTMDTSLLSGGNSRQAAFCLYYFVPPQVFDAMFPDQGIRQLAVNIDHSQQDSFEAYLDEYEQGLYQGIGITRRSEYQANFVSARLNTVLASLIVGIVFAAIALLNFMNLLAAKALSRKQEFAVYESLGMSRSQLKRLVFLEGILYGALMAVVIIPVTVLFEYFVMPGVIENIGSWAMVYTFTLMPMGIIVPLIAVCSIAVPMLCLHLITRGSIIQRMHVIE